ncbi:tRNA pseudouridine(13) synthase TruD [Candidatus Parcubacteria bacterium]|nr:tRNA pseudouridine(13) synthase TruD [Candidatus Parcubacteria bacterium]
MESERMRLMAIERARLAEEKAKSPELFPEVTWVDNAETLEILGIHIPDKEKFPQGFLKLLPSDFIVEEVTQDGRQTTIGKESTFTGDAQGETVYATLVKCGLSTIEAVEELAKLLGTTKDKIQYAGIKDKEAITSQEISFRSISKAQVEQLASPHFFLKDIRTGKGVVQKGGLKANRFSILIRIGEDVQDTKLMEAALSALASVKKAGFYNFFYLQRFGTPRLNNYRWGMSILRGEYQKAIVGLISDPGLRELPYFLEMRKEIAKLIPNWARVLEALKEFPLVFPSEIKVVEHLIEHPTDFVGALVRIEEQVMLWVSALASLVYNRKLSAYIMAGVKPPRTLPLLLSPEKNDWLPYIDDLEGIGLFPPNFDNLRRFRSIQLKHREIETIDRPEIYAAEIIPEGLAIQFSLGKGEYATTFLSHFVNLLGGKVPNDIQKEVIDTQNVLGAPHGKDTLDHFAQFNIPKSFDK